MPKCPFCGAKIDHLDFYETKSYDAEVELVDGKLAYSSEGIDVDNRGYDCPKCGLIICTSDDEAIEFLKGGEQ